MTKEENYSRLFSLLLTVSLFTVIVMISNILWRSLFAAILYAHYLLSFKYSFNQLTKVWNKEKGKLLILFIIIASIAFHLSSKVFIIIYFAIHFSLSEVYIQNYLSNKTVDNFPLCDFIYYSFLYLLAFTPSLYAYAESTFISEQYFLIIIIATLITIMPFHFKRRLKNKQTMIIEALFLFFSISAFILKLSFEVGIFYHLLLWIVLPLNKYKAPGKRKKFLYENVYITLAFFLISPLFVYGFSSFPYLDDTYGYFDSFRSTGYFWGYIHISFSFILSDLNPPWIRSLLQRNGIA